MFNEDEYLSKQETQKRFPNEKWEPQMGGDIISYKGQQYKISGFYGDGTISIYDKNKTPNTAGTMKRVNLADVKLVKSKYYAEKRYGVSYNGDNSVTGSFKDYINYVNNRPI